MKKSKVYKVHKVKGSAGYSLIEMVVYIAVFAVLSVVIVNGLLTITSSFLKIRTERAINNTALLAIDNIVRESRLANSVDILNSTFDATPGRLTLNTTINDLPGTVEFYIDNGQLKVRENSIDAGILTPPSIVLDNIVFRLITNGSAQAVKIEITMHDSRDKAYVQKTFYNTALLRGSY